MRFFIPYQIIQIIGMKFLAFYGIQVPVRLVDSTFAIFLFLVMFKWTPPVFNDFDEISGISG